MASGTAFKANMVWIREHQALSEYQNKWVALRKGKLLEAHEDRRVLHDILRRRGAAFSGILFVRLVPTHIQPVSG